jgi:hypothetical protein
MLLFLIPTRECLAALQEQCALMMAVTAQAPPSAQIPSIVVSITSQHLGRHLIIGWPQLAKVASARVPCVGPEISLRFRSRVMILGNRAAPRAYAAKKLCSCTASTDCCRTSENSVQRPGL